MKQVVEFPHEIGTTVQVIGTKIQGKITGLWIGQANKAQALLEWCDKNDNMKSKYFYDEELTTDIE